MDDSLIRQLQHSELFDHTVTAFEVIETHISWVLLTGPYAYKFRKPVNFGFLDFTQLPQRVQDCEQELRLNRRLAPQLYCGLTHIVQRNHQLTILNERPQNSDTLVECAVRMVQFPQQQLLCHREAAGRLQASELENLAERLARFHQQQPSAPSDSDWGSPSTLTQVVRQNFEQIRAHLSHRPAPPELDALEQWSLQQLAAHQPLLEQRRRQGSVREGHGDLHLGNIVLWEGQALPFDCIEFNPRYRWVDTLNDLAFLLMDLEFRQRPQLANQVLNRYLEHTGDYRGCALLPLFKSYRALVRAKVALLGDADGAWVTAAAYCRLADRYRRCPPPTCC